MHSQWGYVALLPLISSLVWIGMLMGMLIYWSTSGRPHYPSMGTYQTIPFISDVGAFHLKPLFISASAVMVTTLNLAFLADRWLRHQSHGHGYSHDQHGQHGQHGRSAAPIRLAPRRLAPNTQFQKIFSYLSIFFAVLGEVGLIILTIFDTYRHHRVHHAMLALFIGGYLISAVMVCIEYQRLAIHFRALWVLRLSFWLKLGFIVVEVVLAIVFAATMSGHTRGHKSTATKASGRRQDVSAGVEWTIAFIFTLYALSYLVDLLPAVHAPGHLPQVHHVDCAAAVAAAATREKDAGAEAVAGGDNSHSHHHLVATTESPSTTNKKQKEPGFAGWLSRAKRGWPDFKG